MPQDIQQVRFGKQLYMLTYNVDTASQHQVHDVHADYTTADSRFVLQLSLQTN